jgi:hypothetical protein
MSLHAERTGDARKWMAAKGGFQVGQTAKAQHGPPCAVTPERDMAAFTHETLAHSPEKQILRKL